MTGYSGDDWQGRIRSLERRIAQLEETETFLRTILDSIQDGISVLDPDLTIAYVNRVMRDWYPHCAPLEGHKCYDCYHGRSLPCDSCPTLRALGSGIPEVEIVPGYPDSTVEWIELFCFPIVDPHTGAVLKVVEYVRNITDQRRTEKQFLQAQKMEAIGTLAGGLAHDFNNLLTGIQGRASLLLEDLAPDHPHCGQVREIEQCVRSAADLTRQLLGFARGDRSVLKPTDMRRLVDDNLQLFGRTRKDIGIHVTHDPELWRVKVDRHQIGQVLLNLLVNAWQAMPCGGDLYLSTENMSIEVDYCRPYRIAPGRYVKVTVTDTGVGMDEKTRQRVFEPFFTTKEGGHGTGLGLASAHGIVKGHNGFINVYSVSGRGTTFNVYLPATDRRTQTEAEEPAALWAGTGTILMVDDEAVILDVAQSMLEHLGYHVLTAATGREAIERFRAEHANIDLVILDMIMPDMGGGAVFDRLRDIDPGVRVLLSSGYGLNAQAGAILKRGCQGFIQKPFSLSQFSEKVKMIISA